MLLWVFVLIRNIFNFTNFTGFYAQRLSKQLGFNANNRFCLKCLLLEYPIWTNVWIVIISMFWFTCLVRIYERPYHEAYDVKNFNNFYNVMYFVMQTMTTIGYGDYLPLSWMGKIFAIVIAYYGVFMMALFVAVCTQQLNFTKEEQHAFSLIMLSDRAANSIIQ